MIQVKQIVVFIIFFLPLFVWAENDSNYYSKHLEEAKIKHQECNKLFSDELIKGNMKKAYAI